VRSVIYLWMKEGCAELAFQLSQVTAQFLNDLT